MARALTLKSYERAVRLQDGDVYVLEVNPPHALCHVQGTGLQLANLLNDGRSTFADQGLGKEVIPASTRSKKLCSPS